MRWPRVVRWVVAAIGLACAVALFVYSRHWTRAGGPRSSAVITDPQATSQQVGVSGIRLDFKTGDKEQIEISKAYEKMPNPSILATQEFMENKIYYRKNDDDLFR